MLYKANFTKKALYQSFFLEFGEFSQNKHKAQLKLYNSDYIKERI